MMKDFEINGDDSSDEEEVGDLIKEYDINLQHSLFLKAEKPSYIQENDPEGYSFLAYALGVKQLYSSNVNKLYYKKKAVLGEARLNVNNEMLEKWFSKTLKSTLKDVFKLERQAELTGKIAADFISQYADVIQDKSQFWVENHLRFFLKQNHAEEILPQIKKCLKNIRKEIENFIEALTCGENEIAAPPFFVLDDFDSSMRSYMKDFFQESGLMSNSGHFIPKKNRPKTKFEGPIEKEMLKIADDYDGRQTVESVKIDSVKSIWLQLLKQELGRGKDAVVEKIEKKYRFKKNMTKQDIEESSIGFLFDEESNLKYSPYDVNKLKNELQIKFEKDFYSTFVRKLKLMQTLLKIKLERGIISQQYQFVSKSVTDFQANLRLSMRLQRRRIRQAKDDEEHEHIMGEVFQTAWQFSEQECLVLENQEISIKGARNDQVINLETYTRINAILLGLKTEINSHLVDHLKINDSLIARWIRDIIAEGKPATIYINIKKRKQISFEDIPERFQKKFLKFLVNFSYLLLGCEVQRNPASLIIHQMALDLIDAKELTWAQAISDSVNEKNFGGGAIPMSMGGYKNDNDRKVTAHPVSCARALHDVYRGFGVKSWRYDGDSSKEMPNNAELVKRENLLVTKWLTLQGLGDKSSRKEKIVAIEEAITAKWYPSSKK